MTETTTRDAAVGLAMISWSVALLHLSAAVGHWGESHLYGGLFLLTAAFQFGWGVVAVVRGASPRWLALGLLINGLVLITYLCSRTVGLPVGPDLHHPETVGAADAVTTFCELVLFALAVLLLVRRRPLGIQVHLVGLVLAGLSLMAFTSLSHVS